MKNDLINKQGKKPKQLQTSSQEEIKIKKSQTETVKKDTKVIENICAKQIFGPKKKTARL